MITDCSTGEVIFSRLLPMEANRKIIELAEDQQVDFLTYEKDVIITNNKDCPYGLIEQKINGMEIRQIEDMKSHLNFPVPKFLFLDDGDYLAMVEPRVKACLLYTSCIITLFLANSRGGLIGLLVFSTIESVVSFIYFLKRNRKKAAKCLVFSPILIVLILSGNLATKNISGNIFQYIQSRKVVLDTLDGQQGYFSTLSLIHICVFLGTEFKSFDQYKEMQCIPKGNTEIWIAYVGTLGHSYDLTRVIDAIRMLNNPNIRFIVLGDGPLKMKFQQYADKKHVHAIFMGRISYPEMVSVLCQCDIAVNPIMKGAAQSIINKVGDYAAAGLPVISTQECKEYRNLIEAYQCGFNCDNENTVELAEKIKILIEHPNMRKKMGNNNRKLGEEKFDRRITYPMICQLLIEEL